MHSSISIYLLVSVIAVLFWYGVIRIGLKIRNLKKNEIDSDHLRKRWFINTTDHAVIIEADPAALELLKANNVEPVQRIYLKPGQGACIQNFYVKFASVRGDKQVSGVFCFDKASFESQRRVIKAQVKAVRDKINSAAKLPPNLHDLESQN